MMEDCWLSVEEIATHLGVKRGPVYERIDGRNMPDHNVGRLQKVGEKEIDDWIRQEGKQARRHGGPV
jgi:DNA binding domain, excisionase family